jgi:hypothetical protein
LNKSYQSRRLHIKSMKNEADLKEPIKEYVHTLNGTGMLKFLLLMLFKISLLQSYTNITACAIPRMLTAIIESNWDAVSILF